MLDIFLDSYVFAGLWSQVKTRPDLTPEIIHSWEKEMLTAGEDPEVYVTIYESKEMYLASAVSLCLFCKKDIVPAPFILWVDKDNYEHHLCVQCALQLVLALGSELESLSLQGDIDVAVTLPQALHRPDRKKRQRGET